MRISSGMIYELGVSAIQNRMAELVKTQQQLAAGRRVLAPSDDPVASAQSLQLKQSLSVVQQYQANITHATNALSLEDKVLAQITRVIQDAKVTAVNAGNPTLSPDNLKALATELKGRYQELLGLANTQDGAGQYLFAGYKSNVKPFTQSSGPGVYAGDTAASPSTTTGRTSSSRACRGRMFSRPWTISSTNWVAAASRLPN